jgi:hypothetical protein
MMERQIDRPIPMPSGLLVKKASNSRSILSGSDANAGVLRRNEQLAVFAEFGLDCQFARPVNDRFHRVDRVND